METTTEGYTITSSGEQKITHEAEDVRSERALGAGSAAELVGGAATAGLAIIGLAGVAPRGLLGVACIAAGGTMLIGAAAEGTRVRVAHNGRQRTEIGGGLSAEALAGAIAVVLGILGLIGLAPGALLPIAAMALGAGVLFGAIVPAREEFFGIHARRELRMGEGAGAVDGLVGAGAITLGILALAGINWTVLSLVALLAIGAGMTLTGATLFGSVIAKERHAHA